MKFWKAVTVAIGIIVSSSANSALLERLGGLAYYDDVADLTWLADANAGYRSSYDTYWTQDGRMSWDNANAWATNLEVNGVTGWRLPSASNLDGSTTDDAILSNIGTEDYGFNISAPGTLYEGSTAKELSLLYYYTLGNLGLCDPVLSTIETCSQITGYGPSNTGPFSNVFRGGYWTASDASHVFQGHWYFNMDNGFQSASYDDNVLYAWAVHSGDVSAVPVPAAFWLFGSGIISLVGLAKRKKV